MHKLGINIYDKPKIMINLLEVCFDIRRKLAQVGHRNINIFSYKKSSRQILHKRKTIYIQRFTP
jgi:hypothetical protein